MRADLDVHVGGRGAERDERARHQVEVVALRRAQQRPDIAKITSCQQC